MLTRKKRKSAAKLFYHDKIFKTNTNGCHPEPIVFNVGE